MYDNSQFVVIMSKEKELPFEKLTIGEFFTEAEKQFPVWQKIVPVSADNYAKARRILPDLKKNIKANGMRLRNLILVMLISIL